MITDTVYNAIRVSSQMVLTFEFIQQVKYSFKLKTTTTTTTKQLKSYVLLSATVSSVMQGGSNF